MNIEEFRQYCLSKKAVTEEFPFDEQTLVFKVLGKMFAHTDAERDTFLRDVSASDWWSEGKEQPDDK